MTASAKRRLGRGVLDLKRRDRDGDGDGRQPVYVDAHTVFEVRRLLAAMTAGNKDRDFAEIVNSVAVNAPYLQQTLIYWIDLIEVLVQSVERRYTPGSGPQKKDEVKAIVMFVVRTNKLQLPASVPSYLRPVVVDLGADMAVDAIVALFNQQDRLPGPNAWVAPAPKPSFSQRWRQLAGRLLSILRKLFGPLLGLLARCGSRIYLALRYPVRVSPALKSALAAIEEKSELMRDRDTADEVAKLLQTIADNADALTAGVQLLGIVVQEVDELTHLSGPQKKVYARQLAFAVLEDAGVDTRGPISSVKLGFAIDMGIELVVHLFKKNNVLAPRRT